MADITSTITSLAPNVSMSGVLKFAGYLCLIVIFLAIVITGVILLIRALKFRWKAVIFEDVNGIPCPVKKERGNFINKGMKVFRLLKSKRIVPYPSFQTGKNTYWFYNHNGKLYNIRPSKWFEEAKAIGVDFAPIELDYALSALVQSMKDRMDKGGFGKWAKENAGVLVSIVFFALILTFFFLYLGKLGGLVDKLTEAIEVERDLDKTTSAKLTALDNIVNRGGSGYEPAG